MPHCELVLDEMGRTQSEKLLCHIVDLRWMKQVEQSKKLLSPVVDLYWMRSLEIKVILLN